ncbi:TPA: aminoacyltransferase, partial [Enterococcus faecium]|nr:aminoacyltransferase [Enterococcus faecium]
MKFVTLTEQEYQLFIEKHVVHYTQSIEHYNYRQKHKKDVHLVGVKDNEEVIAACLLSEAQVLKIFKYFYSHRGPVLDFNNEKLVECFFTGLTRYLKRHKGLFVLVDPYILENNRDADGRILKSYDNSNLINQLNHLGYQYQGHSIGYSDKSQIRWLSVLDLEGKNEKDILNEMDYQTRRNIKKTYEMGVEVKTLDISQTDQFFELFRMAEEKHGFKFREKDYFEEMQNIYNNNSALKLAYIDLKKYL